MNDPVEASSWTQTFAMFTWMHGVCVGVLVPLMAGAAALGTRWRGTARERALRLGWAGAMLAFIVTTDVIYLLPANYDPAWSFPIHVCDLMALVACLALLVRARWLATMTVFWGLALCTQAFFTPVLKVGPVFLHFWYFWLSHTAIVGSAVYLVAVDRYRPTARDLALAWVLLFGYVGWVLPADIAYGWNYGYVGKHAAPGTIIAKLGEWPERVYWLGVLACGGMFLVYAGFAAAAAAARALSRWTTARRTRR